MLLYFNIYKHIILDRAHLHRGWLIGMRGDGGLIRLLLWLWLLLWEGRYRWQFFLFYWLFIVLVFVVRRQRHDLRVRVVLDPLADDHVQRNVLLSLSYPHLHHASHSCRRTSNATENRQPTTSSSRTRLGKPMCSALTLLCL